MEIYKQYIISTTDEIVIGILSQFNFEAFEEQADQTIAYISEKEWSGDLDTAVQTICNDRDITCVLEDIEPQNWNEEWEKNFSPVDIGNFCTIRADFHEKPKGFEYTLLLQPKMAFGTGHHETTYMMINRMASLEIKGKTVLDYGCGTGILAVLAKMIGSEFTLAIDIEEESYTNTLENASKNKVSIDKVLCGTIEHVPPFEYDLVLANINRNVLINTADETISFVKQGGDLLMSGILTEDLDKIKTTYLSKGLKLIDSQQRGNWMCLQWRK